MVFFKLQENYYLEKRAAGRRLNKTLDLEHVLLYVDSTNFDAEKQLRLISF
jgi:hypothetical protein